MVGGGLMDNRMYNDVLVYDDYEDLVVWGNKIG